MKYFLVLLSLSLTLFTYHLYSTTAEMHTRGPGECNNCHSNLTTSSAKYTHTSEVPCSGCHMPHDGDSNSALIGDPIALCLEPCHTNTGRSHKTGYQLKNPTSGIIQDITCTNVCHDPHTSKNEGLLRVSGKELCFTCHDF